MVQDFCPLVENGDQTRVEKADTIWDSGRGLLNRRWAEAAVLLCPAQAGVAIAEMAPRPRKLDASSER